MNKIGKYSCIFYIFLLFLLSGCPEIEEGQNIDEFTVTFNATGGSDVASQKVESGKLASLPADPARTGYRFDGWYKEEEATNSWNFTTNTVTEDITLWAKWVIISYTITYNLNDGTNNSENPTNYNINSETISFNQPTRIGFSFSGWYDNVDCLGPEITEIVNGSTENVEIWAKWTVNQYNVTFDSNSGSEVEQQILDYDSTVAEPTDPTRGGFIFKEWYEDEELSIIWDFTTNTVTEDITLYARWDWAVYNLRDVGPAGGLIFYINSNAISDGWKYLEAAPVDTEWDSKWWGKNGTEVGGTGTGIGTGSANTTVIVDKLNEDPADSDRAAQLCDSLISGGYSDWFLPSVDELDQMCWILHSRRWDGSAQDNPDYGSNRVGGFSDDTYWSSSENSANFAKTFIFSDGNPNSAGKATAGLRTRAIRAF
ncbi:MAG: InlB B-repeat-containing protein [Spirochaetales bacterium]|nr:InlB B-repeat-containing protein [Spirochaetales bacterium]